MKKIQSLSLLVLALLGAACSPKLIPGLDIELADTTDHREILKVLDSYQKAFEQKNIDALLELASAKFFDASGSADTNDDYDYQGLRKHFTEHFSKIDQCQLAVQLKDVKVDGLQATVDYHYTTRYLMKLPSGDKWQIADDINRMTLAKENDTWKILSGM